MNAPAEFRPPRLLRNCHVQSVLASSGLRRFLVRRGDSQLEREARELILDGGDGVRLQGFLTRQSRQAGARALVVLLHGWEGRADSNYVLRTGTRLLEEGFDVFRLHFRDHGDTHALNPGLFHSCRIGEVVNAIADLSRRIPHRHLCVAGYSLGGNFALRFALRAPTAGIELEQALAVCPVINPQAGLEAIETAPWFYEQYFLRKWGRSLRRKQTLFPEHYHFGREELHASLRDLTAAMVERYTEFPDLKAYLDAYSITGDCLAGLRVPASILAASDDPVIPIADFHALQLPANARLQITAFGGHCGFIRDYHLRGFAEDWVTAEIVARLG